MPFPAASVWAAEAGDLVARWLNFYPSQQKLLAPGARVRLFGAVRGGFLGDEMIHPRVRRVEAGEALPDSLTPVYPTTAGLAQSALRKLVGRALERFDGPEMLPGDAVRALGLPGFGEALRALHRPPRVQTQRRWKRASIPPGGASSSRSWWCSSSRCAAPTTRAG